MEPNSQEIEQWQKDPKNWVWGMFYYNKKDSRIFVPKRIQWMGITVNFANQKTYLFLLGALLFFCFIVFMINQTNAT
jgi:uncharacterized membrane protein